MQVELDRAERLIAKAVAGESGLVGPGDPEHVELRGLVDRFVLSPVECDVLRILLAVELRPAVGRSLDKLTGRDDGRPSVAALAAIASVVDPVASDAVLAAADGAAVAMRHLVIAVWREVRKSGRLVGADDFGPWRDTVKALERPR